MRAMYPTHPKAATTEQETVSVSEASPDAGAPPGKPWRNALPLSLLIAAATAAFCGIVIHPRAFVVAAVIAAILLLGYLLPWLTVRRMRGQMTFPRRRGQVGRKLKVELRLRNPWLWAVHGLVVRGEWGGVSKRAADSARLVIPRLPPWRETLLLRTILPQRRGVFPLDPPTIASSFPFGLLTVRRRLTTVGQVVVWPELVPLPPSRDGLRSRSYGELIDDQRVGTVGEIRGTRPYVAGESLRRVHWRQTARHGRLIVCERSAPARHGVQVLLETAPEVHQGPAGEATLEAAISIAASLAAAMVDTGIRASLVFERHRAFEAESRAGLAPALDALARLHADHGTPLRHLLENPEYRAFDHGTQLIVTTKAGMQRLGSHSLGADNRYHFFLVDADGQSDGKGGEPRIANSAVVHLIPVNDPGHRQLHKAWKELACGI